MTVKGIAARRATAGPWSFLGGDATGREPLAKRVVVNNTPLALSQIQASGCRGSTTANLLPFFFGMAHPHCPQCISAPFANSGCSRRRAGLDNSGDTRRPARNMRDLPEHTSHKRPAETTKQHQRRPLRPPAGRERAKRLPG